MKPKEFTAVDRDRLHDYMPVNHPATEEPRETLFQAAALPALLWFFDQERNRGTGRSHLMATVLIELAMRGQEVILEDLSVAPQEGRRYSYTRRFADTVLKLAHEVYQGHYFRYDHANNRLSYRGRKPR